MNSDLLEKLSLKTFIGLRNSSLGFFATPETNIWYIEAEHCTYRSFRIQLEGRNLNFLLEKALHMIEDFEMNVKRKRKAMEVLHPDKNEYEIADMLRVELRMANT